ncbi:MAG: long-chain fatty acid--CoA ligase [Alphaproteobacteria bacterium]|nr:long-chain fatty acid--CoA ligase [Alphaproteobacteria bacterium]
MNVAHLLAKAATQHPDRPAVVRGRRTYLAYAELAGRAASLAASLRRTLAPGARVALAMGNCPEYLEILFGAWWAGLCAVPMNARLHPREFAFILEQSGSRLAFATPDLAASVAPLADTVPGLERVIPVGGAEYRALFAAMPAPLAPAAPADPAWLFYTSGTTGRPKGATLTHRNLMFATLSHLADVDTIGPADCIIHAAPMSHGSGIYILPHVAKAAAQVIPESGHFDPAEVLDLIRYHPRASFFFAPTMVQRLVAAAGGTDTTNLKTLVYGGGPMYLADLEQALAAFGPKLAQIYGQGESPMTITSVSKAVHADAAHPRRRERLASVGVARTDTLVRVVDASDRDVAVGEIGEVLVKGEVVMAGYWGDAEATAATLRGGWLHTGDLGALDADGFLTLKDRSKDLIISGGSNIYPREVEEVLLTHADVAEAAVVGRPDPEWGEEVVAFVVARPGAVLEPAALDALCLARIARYKRPKAYRFVAALPKNNYGKVLKTVLRDLLAGQS